MAYAGTPVLHKRLLWLSGSPTDIQIDTPAWFCWLQTATSFSYPLGRPTYASVTLRQEKRRRGLYWYAYLKIDAKLHNSYVGTSATLTAEKLDKVAKQLLAKVSQTPPATARKEVNSYAECNPVSTTNRSWFVAQSRSLSDSHRLAC